MKQSLQPGKWFWVTVIGLSVACVVFFYMTGIADTQAGAIASDFLGMAGSITLLYAAAQSLPTRARVESLVQLAASSEDRIVARIRQQFSEEVSAMAKSNIRKEWRLSILGAGMLSASFGIAMSKALLSIS